MDLQDDYNVDGFVARHKTHLATKIFSKLEGIDFNQN
jgi:hypothetical protein